MHTSHLNDSTFVHMYVRMYAQSAMLKLIQVDDKTDPPKDTDDDDVRYSDEPTAVVPPSNDDKKEDDDNNKKDDDEIKKKNDPSVCTYVYAPYGLQVFVVVNFINFLKNRIIS